MWNTRGWTEATLSIGAVVDGRSRLEIHLKCGGTSASACQREICFEVLFDLPGYWQRLSN